MDRKNLRGSQKLVISVVGAALAVPLIAAPASAALDDGNFQIRSVNTENDQIFATAGMKNAISVDDPDDGEATIPSSVSYQCGPMGYTVTQSMMNLQAANQKAQAEGRTGDIKASADGWKSIWSYSTSGTSGGFTPGLPAPGASGDEVIYFSKTMDTPQLADVITGVPASTSLKIVRDGSYCEITDLRKAPAAGDRYSYKIASFGYSEGRYLTQDGELQAVTSLVYTNGEGIRMSERHSATHVSEYIESSKTPSAVTVYDTGLASLEFTLGKITDGYNHISVTRLADGSQSVRYTLIDENADPRISTAVRSHGPSTVNTDSTGKITKVTYINSSGKEIALTNPTVTQYNTTTGQDWDGSYPKFSNFDSSIPFVPTAP